VTVSTGQTPEIAHAIRNKTKGESTENMSVMFDGAAYCKHILHRNKGRIQKQLRKNTKYSTIYHINYPRNKCVCNWHVLKNL